MTIMDDELRKIVEEMEAPNIAIIGKTGTGKSTLINKVFGVEKAETNTGLPVTQSFKLYTPDHSSVDTRKPINLYDSAGYEANKEHEFQANLLNFIETQKAEGLESQIHLVWYVINAASKRFEGFDADIINELNRLAIPVIIVLSQCDIVSYEDIYKLKDVIINCKFNKAYDILEVAAKPLEKYNGPICQAFGLEELVSKTVELLPTIYSDAIVANQIVSIGEKKRVAWKYIAAAAATCFASGFVPVPLTSVIAMTSSQVGLLKAIAKLYNSDDILEIIDQISGQTIVTAISVPATAALEISATFLVGLFPPGFLVAEVAAGGVAATYVVMMGLTYTSVFEKLSKRRLNRPQSRQEIKEFLKRTFRQELQRYLTIKVNSKESLDQIRDDFLSDRAQDDQD
ncbi:MAG: GTPase domain-containing protein [Moorea sp. SIO4A3]|nr:GTPase domain-containing protein [Moorena sp. SIO4A3]